ncbi:hypothetical protein Tco_0788818 [Tanacetum coccineum]
MERITPLDLLGDMKRQHALSNAPSKAVGRSSTLAPNKVPSKDKSVAYKIKNITLRMIASSKRTKTRNREPETQATVEARVAPEQSDPPSGSKHSPTCSCRACVAKRLRVKNMTEKASQKPPIRRKRKVPEPAEPLNQQTITLRSGSEENQNERREPSQSAEPSNLQAISVNRDSEDNQNDQSLTGSHSNNTIRPLFDLNLLACDDDEDFVDPTRQYTNGYSGYLSE